MLFGKDNCEMAKQTELAVSPREITGKATKRLRARGIIPANIFGHGAEPQAIQLTSVDFEGLLREHKTSSVVALKIAGTQQSQTALVRHVQRGPVSGKILHVDFLRINMQDKVTSRVPLHFEGVPSGVKIGGGVLLHLLEALEVECAASDIVQFLAVDISHMEKIDDMLHARDVKLPPNYTLITDPEEPVVKITPPRAEKGTEAGAAPATPAAPTESTTA